MDAKKLFQRALEEATGVIASVEPTHFKRNTPCSDWSCRQLVNHMLSELAWVPDLLAGKTVGEVGDRYDGDLIKEDLHGTWHILAYKAMTAVHNVDPDATIHLSYADVTAGHYIQEIGGDLLLHAWDTDQSLYCSLIFDKVVAQTLYESILPRVEEFTASGLFAKPVSTTSDRVQAKLLGLVGRREPETV